MDSGLPRPIAAVGHFFPPQVWKCHSQGCCPQPPQVQLDEPCACPEWREVHFLVNPGGTFRASQCNPCSLWLGARAVAVPQAGGQVPEPDTPLPTMTTRKSPYLFVALVSSFRKWRWLYHNKYNTSIPIFWMHSECKSLFFTLWYFYI